MSEVRVVPVPMRMGPMSVMAYLLLGDSTVVVDTGIAGQEGRILARLAKEGRTGADVSLILLTHGHRDHAGSASALKEATGAPIALGAGDEEKYAAGRDTEMRARSATGALLMRFLRRRARPEHAALPAPDLIIDIETSLAPYGVDAVVVPTPGHSRGSLSVFTGGGDALVGDLLGGGGRSRPRPERGIFVSDEAAMDASIAAVLARAPRRVFTGHDMESFTFEQLATAFGDGA